MKIVFLCGTLEPGKDGVGDYTRRLAGELIRSGYSSGIIALNDFFVSTITEGNQIDEKKEVETLRMPATLALSERVSVVQRWLNTAKPDWISLQFVLYAFHPKGLPFQWLDFFKKLRVNSRWQIMLHELWIGSKKQDSLKTKMIGIAQRFIVKRLLQAISPSAITTNVVYYQNLLKALGKEASVLPVFSNMPFGSLQNNFIINKFLPEIQDHRTEWLVIAMFGGVSSSVEVNTHFEQLVQKAVGENKKVFLVHIGRSGNPGSFFENIREKNVCKLLTLGEQSSTDIASFFLQADLGISTYDAEFLGKSSSVAGILYNKLPVVLLKAAEEVAIINYPYAKFVKDIDSLHSFSTQSTEWSTLFSLQHAAAFYNDLLTKSNE